MFNLVGVALAAEQEGEHLAHHSSDKIANLSSMMGNYQGGNMMNMMGYMMGNLGSWGTGWGWTMIIFGWIFWILVLVALILLIVYLIKLIKK